MLSDALLCISSRIHAVDCLSLVLAAAQGGTPQVLGAFLQMKRVSAVITG